MRILIIGNGFDLDLGLNSRYSDFAKSKEWTDLYNANRCDNNLAEYLYQQSKIDNWFDIEKCIRDYVQMKEAKNDYDESNVYMDRWFLKDLEKRFDEYLSGEILFAQLNEKSLAAKIMLANKDKSCFNLIYSFNYVEYNFLPEITNGHVGRLEDVQYVHGIGQYLIFGIDEDGCKSSQYSFTKKAMHPNYPSTNIIPDMMLADEVVIFGHSINAIDWKYFQLFFEDNCKYVKDPKRQITIITKDDESKKQLKDNLNDFGVSITLLNSISNLVFIETDSYYKGSYEEIEKVRRLLSSFD